MTPEKARTLAANIRGAKNQGDARTRWNGACAYCYAMHETGCLSDDNLAVSLEFLSEAFSQRMRLGQPLSRLLTREMLGLD